jgi:hypothetical protein
MKSFIKPIVLFVGAALFSGSALANEPEWKLSEAEHSIIKKRSVMQDSDNSFGEGTRVLSIGLGFGGGNYYKSGAGFGHSYGRSPLFTLGYEYGLPMRVGPGYIGVGPWVSYQNVFSQYDNLYYNGGKYYYKHNWNLITVAAKGAYHFDFLNGERFELFAGPIIGARINSYSYTSNSPDPEKDYYKLNQKSIDPVAGLFIGGRWNFSNHTGLFAETGGGTGLSFATIGIHFRF